MLGRRRHLHPSIPSSQIDRWRLFVEEEVDRHHDLMSLAVVGHYLLAEVLGIADWIGTLSLCLYSGEGEEVKSRSSHGSSGWSDELAPC